MKNNQDCNDRVTRRNQGKRRLADIKECQSELKEAFKMLIDSFNEAKILADERLAIYPVHMRPRTLDAIIIQSCFVEVVSRNFSGKVILGKYKRVIIKIRGYLILFKKLNKKMFPMNIRTKNVQSMLNQNQTLSLFDETDHEEDPILYFGYQKNKFGEYTSPQLVYIDDSTVKFLISHGENQIPIPFTQDVNLENNKAKVEVSPKLKSKNLSRKAN